MKKKNIEKLSKLTYDEIDDMDEDDAVLLMKEILPTGDRFKCAAMYDHDWWYAVRYVLDIHEKNTLRNFIVVRSYSTHKARWTYRILGVKELLYMLHLDCEA